MPLLSVIEKVLAPTGPNSGTSVQLAVNVELVRSNVTAPPEPASRSSQRPAIRGGPARNSGTVSVKSALAAPKVRLPFAFTNTAEYDWPQSENGNPIESWMAPSSPTGRWSPGRNSLKITSVPVRTPPAAALTAVNSAGLSTAPSLDSEPP